MGARSLRVNAFPSRVRAFTASEPILCGKWRVGDSVRELLDLRGIQAPRFRFQRAFLLLREVRERHN